MRTQEKLKPSGFYWSASRYNLFKACEKCFWLKYMDCVPSDVEDESPYLYGRYIHEAIEAIEEGENVSDINDIIVRTGRFDDIEMASKHIELYREYKPKLNLVNGVNEVEFSLKTNIKHPTEKGKKLHFYGFLDRVEYETKSKRLPKSILIEGKTIRGFDEKGKEVKDFKVVKVVEYKTKASKWSYNAIMGEYQFTLYYYVARALTGSKNPLMQLVTFVRGKTAEIQVERITRDKEAIDKFLKVTREVIKKIEKKDIQKVSSCPFFSSYKDICKTYEV